MMIFNSQHFLQQYITKILHSNYYIMQSDYYEPTQEEEENENLRLGLTPEETEAAFVFLRRMFPNYPLDMVVCSLDHYVHGSKLPPQEYLQRQAIVSKCRANTRRPPMENEEGYTVPNAQKQREMKKQKSEENLQIIARLFCEHGYDFHKANQLLPEISQSIYRNALNCIINTVFNQLLKLIRQQGKVELELSPFHKSLIREQLVYAHSWLGKMSTSALSTLFKLISQRFQNNKLMFQNNDYIELYNCIARRLTDKNVDLSQINVPLRMFGKEIEKEIKPMRNMQLQQRSKTNTAPILSEDDVSLGHYFLKYKSIEKIHEALVKFGKNKKVSTKSIENSIGEIIKMSIKKLLRDIGNAQSARNIFGGVLDQSVAGSIMARGSNELKLMMVEYFAGKTKKSNTETTILLLNEFLDAEAMRNHQKCSQEQEENRNNHQEVEREVDPHNDNLEEIEGNISHESNDPFEANENDYSLNSMQWFIK